MENRDLYAIRFAASWDDLSLPEQDILTFLMTQRADDYVPRSFRGNVHDLCNAMGVSNKAQNANYRRALFRLEERGLIVISYGDATKYKAIKGCTVVPDWIERMDGSYLI